MNKILVRVLPVMMLAFPFVAFAQEPNLNWFTTLVSGSQSIVGNLVTLFFGIALVAFLFGIIKFIFAAGDEEGRKQGKNIMIAGLIALFVAFTVYGLIGWMQSITGVDPEETTTTPRVPS